MKKWLYLFCLFFFLFFFITHADAYEMISDNPYINDSTSNLPDGIVLYNDVYNNSFYQNATCAGFTNCIIIESNGTTQLNRIYMQQYDWLYASQESQWTNYTTLMAFSENNKQFGVKYLEVFLPKNNEGILVFNYRFNNTLTTPAPTLKIDSPNTIVTIYLNTTANSWRNETYILNRSVLDRNLKIRIDWYWGNTSTNFMIDKFKFYTVDVSEARTQWDTNITAEQNRYCGNNLGWADTSNLCSDSANYPLPYFKIWNANTAWLICNESDVEVVAIKIGDTTRARRVASKEMARSYISCDNANSFSYGLWILDDNTMFGYFETLVCNPWCFNQYYYMESMSLTTSKITLLSGNYSTSTAYPYIVFNGVPANRVNLWNSTDGLFNYLNNSGLYAQNINILPFNNISTPGGTQFRICQQTNYLCSSGSSSSHPLDPSAWHPFFTTTTTYESGWSCSPSTNNESYSASNGSLLYNIWCGNCGCGATRCNYPTITGTLCDLTDSARKGFTTNLSDCTSNYGLCGMNEICTQYTNTIEGTDITYNTIACQNQNTGINDYCINTTGSSVSCSVIDTIVKNITGNVMAGNYSITNTASLAISRLWGLPSNLGAPIWALLLSMMLSTVTTIVITTKAHVSGQGAGTIFITSILLWIFVFVLGGMLEFWVGFLMISIVVLILLSFMVKPFLHGGK
jgi:hypothetical protein